MVQKIRMDFSQSGASHGKAMTISPNIITRQTSSKVSLASTLSHCVEMKQMLRRLQGLSSGCSSCGKGKK
jgi:hypothetical protein